MLRLVVLGAGGHAKVVIATAQAAGHEVIAIFDDSPERQGQTVLGVPIEGKVDAASARYPDCHAVVGIGDNRARLAVAARVGLPFAALMHPTSWVSPDVEVGEGTVVFAGSIVQPGTKLGKHCVLNTGCSVDHDCRLADASQVAPGARLAGNIELGEGALVGMGSCVIQNLSVGAWSVIGAGAAVVRDVPETVTVKGVPAR